MVSNVPLRTALKEMYVIRHVGLKYALKQVGVL